MICCDEEIVYDEETARFRFHPGSRRHGVWFMVCPTCSAEVPMLEGAT